MIETVELTHRQEMILGLVTREYVATGVPVGSKRLIKRYDLGVSPATVRSEMAFLERAGYLTHPHTSAGRMPTEHGYRYFVERLMEETTLPVAEQRLIRHQFHQTRMDLSQWMKLAAAVLAHVSHVASLVTAPKSAQCRLRHLELIPIREGVVLLIVVLSEGLVKQRFLSVPPAVLSREELSSGASYLSSLWENCTRHEIRNMDLPPGADSLDEEVRRAVVDIMNRVDRRTTTEIYRDGLLYILRQPDFADSESLRQAVTFMEERQLLESVLSEVIAGEEVQVIIGGEDRWPELSTLSLVVAPYGDESIGGATGIMGVVGPMRMPYQRNISVVRYVADLMTAMLRDLYGDL
jgi:heat-inducible transcriptional repressor